MPARKIALIAVTLLGLVTVPAGAAGPQDRAKPDNAKSKPRACVPVRRDDDDTAGPGGSVPSPPPGAKRERKGDKLIPCPPIAVAAPAMVKGSGFFGGGIAPLLGLGGAGGGIAASVAADGGPSPASP